MLSLPSFPFLSPLPGVPNLLLAAGSSVIDYAHGTKRSAKQSFQGKLTHAIRNSSLSHSLEKGIRCDADKRNQTRHKETLGSPAPFHDQATGLFPSRTCYEGRFDMIPTFPRDFVLPRYSRPQASVVAGLKSGSKPCTTYFLILTLISLDSCCCTLDWRVMEACSKMRLGGCKAWPHHWTLNSMLLGCLAPPSC